MMLHWYALHTKPHKERQVAQLLASLAAPFFLPLVYVQPKNPRAAKQRPYFPGYLFVQANLVDVGLNYFNWMEGVHGLVTFGDTPAVVSNELIQALEQHLQRLNARGGLAHLRPGDTVAIVSGPLVGHTGLFDAYLPGRDRVRILLTYLNQSQLVVNLNAGDIGQKL